MCVCVFQTACCRSVKDVNVSGRWCPLSCRDVSISSGCILTLIFPISIDKTHTSAVLIHSLTVFFAVWTSDWTLICACEHHPWLINISATMRVGVSHVHHPGNELALASLRAVYHSAAAPHTQRHSPCLITNIPLIRPINQSITQPWHALPAHLPRFHLLEQW